MLKSIKIRIYPDAVQKQFISKQLGCCRFIYNKLLDYKKIQYEQNKQKVSLSQLEKNKYELILRRGVEYGKNVIKKELLKEMYKSPCESCGNYMMSDDCVCNKLYKYCDFIKEAKKRLEK